MIVICTDNQNLNTTSPSLVISMGIIFVIAQGSATEMTGDSAWGALPLARLSRFYPNPAWY